MNLEVIDSQTWPIGAEDLEAVLNKAGAFFPRLHTLQLDAQYYTSITESKFPSLKTLVLRNWTDIAPRGTKFSVHRTLDKLVLKQCSGGHCLPPKIEKLPFPMLRIF